MIMKRSVFKYWGGLAALLALFGFIGCSDEPDEMNYYTFKGQMMSDYLLKTEQFSDFATLVNRAGMMDMLSSYGSYTCFAPTNAALQDYIKGKGLRSLRGYGQQDCPCHFRTSRRLGRERNHATRNGSVGKLQPDVAEGVGAKR